MDDTSTNQTTVTSPQLKRVGRALRPSTAKGLRYDYHQLPYTEWPGYWQNCRFAQQRLNARVNHNNRQRKAAHASRGWVIDSEDGAALARSNCWLPSDGSRQKKPRLERQEAFRVPEVVYTSDVVDNDADLYRMGLLYDDEHLRGSGFNLNSIVHSDLVYEIRPAKRARRSYRYIECTQGANERDENGSLLLDQLLTSIFEARSTSQMEGGTAAAMAYSTPPSTPPHDILDVTGGMTHSLTPLLRRSHLLSDIQTCGNSDLEDGDSVSVCDWVDLRCSGSDADTVSDLTEDEADIATETWIVLGET